MLVDVLFKVTQKSKIWVFVITALLMWWDSFFSISEASVNGAGIGILAAWVVGVLYFLFFIGSGYALFSKVIVPSVTDFISLFGIAISTSSLSAVVQGLRSPDVPALAVGVDLFTTLAILLLSLIVILEPISRKT